MRLINESTNYFFRQYFWLIRRFENFPDKDDYTEDHHIYPKAIYRESSEEYTRKVSVNRKHHLILHYLLYRGFQVWLGENSFEAVRMEYAICYMSGLSSGNYICNRSYRALKVSQRVDLSNQLLRSEIQKLCAKIHSKTTYRKTEEHKRNISIARRGKPSNLTPEQRQRLSDSMKGENNVMFGRKHTPEAIAKMRAHERTATHRAKISKSKLGGRGTVSGRFKITNGLEMKYWPPGVEIPKGWYRGVPDCIKKKDKGAAGRCWIHNSVTLKEALVPVGSSSEPGWVKGRAPGRGGSGCQRYQKN